MGQASASSSATTAIDASGAGGLIINRPNYLMWVVVLAALLIGAYWFFNRKK